MNALDRPEAVEHPLCPWRAATSSLLVVLVALGALLACAATASAGPVALGRWEGAGTNGGKIAFTVGYEGKRLVFADPTVMCGEPEQLITGSDQVTKHFGQEWTSNYGDEIVRARVNARGRFHLKERFSIRGRLRGAKGTLSSDVAELGRDCSFGKVAVRQVAGQVRSDGIYSVSGPYATGGTVEVYSGGAAVRFVNYLGGPAEPKVAARFGLAAGQDVCKASLPRGGAFHFPPTSRRSINLARTAAAGAAFVAGNVSGTFTGNRAIVGGYGLVYQAPGTQCPPLGGPWVALQSRKIGPQLDYNRRTGPVRKEAGRRCRTVPGVVDIAISATKYPTVLAHQERAISRGWPSTLVLNRPGASRRRAKAVRQLAAKPGADRDEYPPAVLRGRGSKALRQGVKPTGWKADVEYVPSGENQSAGTTVGNKLRPYCSGQRVAISGY